MTDSTPEVLATLEAALPVPVFVIVPDEDAKLPCVSFFRFSDTSRPADDDEYATTEEFVLDIWGRRYSEISPIMQEVDTAMTGIGFARKASLLIPKDETDTMHQNMTYERTI